jgi:intron-binding protein aquarius
VVQVRAHCKLNVGKYAPFIRSEWDGLREHDVLFLITIRCPIPADPNMASGVSSGNAAGAGNGSDRRFDDDVAFASEYGIVHVRGCELVNTRDEHNNVINDANARLDEKGKVAVGNTRILTVSTSFDCASVYERTMCMFMLALDVSTHNLTI